MKTEPAPGTDRATNPAAIRCRGVSTHNLHDLNIDFPRNKLIAVTGVSGSGKSSLVFDTLYAESQRRFIETLGTYERQFLEGLPEPLVDSVENLPPTVALKQSNRASSPRSLVSTSADLDEPMRQLFSELMPPTCNLCGAAIALTSPADLESTVSRIFSTSGIESLILAVELETGPGIEEKKGLFESLLSEGYLSIYCEGKLLRVEDEIKAGMGSTSGKVFLVLERLHHEQEKEERTHRLEMAWSQVKFSARFSELLLFPALANAQQTGETIRVAVRPRCAQCQTQTSPVTYAQLDWKSASGSCATCHGLGNTPIIDHLKVVPNPELPMSETPIKPWASNTFSWMHDAFVETLLKNGVDPKKTAYQELSDDLKDLLWNGKSGRAATLKISGDFVSVGEFFQRLEDERYKSSSRILSAKYRRYVTCPDCHGHRLAKSGQMPRVAKKTLPEIMESEVVEVLQWLETARNLEEFSRLSSSAREAHAELTKKLGVLNKLGLGSCHLWRRSRTLSGGEYQRVLISRVLGSGLSDALYVLDEPSVGLGLDEISELIPLLREIRDQGNTVVVVDHDKTLITSCDHWIELGPGGGHLGGRLLEKNGSLPRSCVVQTAPEEGVSAELAPTKRTPSKVVLSGFSALNCHMVDLAVELGSLTVLTGPSGAGKSVLASFGLARALDVAGETGRTVNTDLDIDRNQGTWNQLQLPKDFFKNHEVISISQSPLHRSSTSIVATVLDALDPLRKQFALTERAGALNLDASHFSFNSAGACPTCRGKGVVSDDLFFLGEVERDCPDCHRARFAPKTLQIVWKGRNIREWLDLTVAQFEAEAPVPATVRKSLSLARELGLGYLPLSFSTTMLSGGEAQRLRIAARLASGEKKLFCVIDEPTRGLSEYDVKNLVDTLLPLAKKGHTFLVVEHHPQFLERADVLIQMGPGAGRHGGKIVNTIRRR